MNHSSLSELRADQVGSLLRPSKLKEVYARHGDGKATDDELGRIQFEAVKELITKQEGHGLSILTDGEYRRLNFQDSFVESVSGFVPKKQTMQFQESRSAGGEALQRWQPDSAKTDPALQYWRPITERLRLVRNRPLEEWRLAASLTMKPVKVTLITTDRICENFHRQNSQAIYNDADEYRAAVIDGVNDVTFGIHLCRGNVRSMWHREGAYDAIAERLFNGLRHDRFLLEYDSERAGGFEPLRFVPKSKIVVLGLVSTKVPELESADDLKRKIDDASHYIPFEQLALSPQCGFSSNIVGNLLSEDDQWRKLELVQRVADDVWGS